MPRWEAQRRMGHHRKRWVRVLYEAKRVDTAENDTAENDTACRYSRVGGRRRYEHGRGRPRRRRGRRQHGDERGTGEEHHARAREERAARPGSSVRGALNTSVPHRVPREPRVFPRRLGTGGLGTAGVPRG